MDSNERKVIALVCLIMLCYNQPEVIVMATLKAYDFEYEFLQSNAPVLEYKGEPLEEWKPKAKAKLEELLGLPFEKCDPLFQLEYKKDRDGFTEYRFTVQTEKGFVVPCHLLIPATAANGPMPLLCLSGHGSGMHITLGNPKNEEDRRTLEEWPERNMSARALREGRCALVIEARNFGESSENGYGTSCTEAAKVAILMGRTVIGERVWDAMRVLDAVEEHFAEVDMSDIVCTGNSGGGTATYYLSCLDERITVSAPSCSICPYEHSIAAMPHCLCNHIPSIRKYFEMGDLAALIAPRKLVIAAGEKDPIFPIEPTKKCFEHIQYIYRCAEVPNNCALVIGDNGHYNYAELLWAKIHQMGI